MNKLLVFQTDFGLDDGAISAMEGVSFGVSRDLNIRHLTHNIPQYNIFDASYRLYQAINYWPEGTVFVSVVDPGVGSSRKSVVAKTVTGQYIVTPNNGTLTHINKFVGITELREISERTNRLEHSELSYTFHGRDVYAYTGARLAAGVITYEEVGKELPLSDIVELDVVETEYDAAEKSVKGCVDILDVRFGSLWTSISRDDFYQLNPEFGKRYEVSIFHENMLAYQNQVVYQHSFAEVPVGSPLLYINSVYRVGIAINQGSFARAYNVGTGTNWKIRIRAID